MPDERLIWKVRFVKSYPEAHSHLLIGKVVARDTVAVELMCKSFHHGKVANTIKDVSVGSIDKRIIPWNRIEVINELPKSFDFQNAELKEDKKGGIFLSDGHYSCPIVMAHNKHD